MNSIDATDPEELVEEHRERVIKVIRESEDPFTRACAWAILDRYTDDNELKELREEFDAVFGTEGVVG